ncbi:MAG: hypothetical protein QOC82_3160 [Frankiaceae bacterium]|jgi:hypothetical protein|nr:hypothetical protein [Frankiaceae bacterium]
MISRPRRAVTLGLAAVATAAAIVPAAAATKAKGPKPLTIYPSTTSCPQGQGSATYALDIVPGDDSNDCLGFVVGVSGGKPEGPRSDEDYVATSRAKVKLAKSGAITGNIGIKALAPGAGAPFVGYADVTLSLVINGVEVGTPIEKSGPITPTADLVVPVNVAIPAALRGKKINSMDLLLHWNVAGGATFLDVNASSLKLPRS